MALNAFVSQVSNLKLLIFILKIFKFEKKL